MRKKVKKIKKKSDIMKDKKITSQEEQEVQAVPEVDTQTQENVEQSETVQPDFEQEVAELKEKCADLQDKNIRMMAEFDNYRRRTNKEKLDLMATAGESIFKDILTIVDDFERAQQAMQNTDDINAVREGIDLIYNKFIAFLEKNNVKAIETDNADFDTEFHEAITTFPAPSEELKGKVIDCTQKGYTLAGKVIRYAKVVVGE